jgi:hypothetical protein
LRKKLKEKNPQVTWLAGETALPRTAARRGELGAAPSGLPHALPEERDEERYDLVSTEMRVFSPFSLFFERFSQINFFGKTSKNGP